MVSHTNFSFGKRVVIVLFVVTCSAVLVLSASETRVDDGPGFCKVLKAKNYCYMTRVYIPKDELEEKVPDRMSIPSDAEMMEYFPNTPLKEGYHPMMISVCLGTGVADVYTNIALSDQEETMILVPLIYTRPFNRGSHMVAFCPVLYLDTKGGVLGGYFYGLRKEYHPEIETVTTDKEKWLTMIGNDQWKDSLDVYYQQTGTDLGEDGIDNFFMQLFNMVYVTYSYPVPVPYYMFMRVGVFPRGVKMANELVNYTWKGTSILDSDDMMSQFADYVYTTSWPLTAEMAFEGTSSPGIEGVRSGLCR